jgi:hypothetical protein
MSFTACRPHTPVLLGLSTALQNLAACAFLLLFPAAASLGWSRSTSSGAGSAPGQTSVCLLESRRLRACRAAQVCVHIKAAGCEGGLARRQHVKFNSIGLLTWGICWHARGRPFPCGAGGLPCACRACHSGCPGQCGCSPQQIASPAGCLLSHSRLLLLCLQGSFVPADRSTFSGTPDTPWGSRGEQQAIAIVVCHCMATLKSLHLKIQ